MGPVKQLAIIPFAGGLDTKTDPRIVQPGKLLQAQNVVFKQTGSLNRRWGYSRLGRGVQLPNTSPISNGQQLATYNNELLLFDAMNVWGYNARTDSWTNRASTTNPNGSTYNVVQNNTSIQRTTGQQVSVDSASLNGVDVYVWEDQTNIGGVIAANGIRYSVYDSASGTPLFENQQIFQLVPLSGNIRPKVVAVPSVGRLVFMWVDSTRSTLNLVQIDPANPSVSPSLTAQVNNFLSTPFFDACVTPSLQSDGTQLIIAYSGAGNVLSYITVQPNADGSFSFPHTYSVAGFPASHSASGCINIAPEQSGTGFWICAADNGANSVSCSLAKYTGQGAAQSFLVQSIVDTAQLQTITTAVTGAGASATAYTIAEVIGTPIQNVTTNFIRYSVCSSAGALSWAANSTHTVSRGMGLASKAFVSPSGSVFVNGAFQSPLQSTYFTLDLAGNVVAKALSGVGGGLIASSDAILPECSQISPGVFRYASLVKGAPNTQNNTVVSLLGVNSCTLDFTKQGIQTLQVAGGLVATGGVVQSYDGRHFAEQNFHIYPEGITYTPGGADGSLSVGVYFYAVVWSWPDATGLVYYSTPSTATAVTVAANQHVTIVVPTLRVTAKGTKNVKVEIYRTAVNGTTLTRVTSSTLPTYNDGTVDSISYTDKASDASIAGNGAMYTQPLVVGSNPVLPNSAPPAASLIAAFDQRVFLSGLDDPLSYWLSQQVVQGIPVQFSPFLTGRIDPDGGAITAIVRLDDKLIFFKKSAIFFIAGTGPDATGGGSGYSQPIAVPSGGVGCVNASSVVLTPIGLLFQSSNGIYLLDRGLNVSYKGVPVEAFNSRTITSATLIPNQWVVFTTSSPSGDSAIVYDYFYDQWSTFTNHTAVASCLYQGLFYFLKSDGTVWKQTPALYTDSGAPIPWRIMTAKIALAKIQGYQRVYEAFILGSYRGSGVTLNVGCAFDNSTAINAIAAIPVDSILGIPSPAGSGVFGTEPWLGVADGSTVFQFRCDILRKCESIQFVLSDSQSGSGTEGFALSAITLNVGVKRGGFKMPANKQFGVS